MSSIDIDLSNLKTGVIPKENLRTVIGKKDLPASKEFEKLLKSEVQKDAAPTELQFSAHAKERMNERDIQLTPLEIQKIKEAIQKVSHKGSRESLILSDKGAFIVNVKNQKVITALDPQAARDATFTNIDSTIII